MTVPIFFAFIGIVILIGFFANLLFRVTKIPSVLVLIAIGIILGPVTGWLRHDALLVIAPYFGAVALLVILFEGGLGLEIGHVVRHAPRTAIFTAVVFALSMASVTVVAHLAVGLPLTLALMLGAILGATSPAISAAVKGSSDIHGFLPGGMRGPALAGRVIDLSRAGRSRPRARVWIIIVPRIR